MKHRDHRRFVLLAFIAVGASPAVAYADSGSLGSIGRGAFSCCMGAATVVGTGMMSSGTPRPEPPPPCAERAPLSRAEALASLREIERDALERCQTDVEQPGYVRAHVTVAAHDGRATAAWFEPALHDASFAKCMAEAFGALQVACFEGDAVTLTTTLGGASSASCGAFPVVRVREALTQARRRAQHRCFASVPPVEGRAYVALEAEHGRAKAVWFDPPIADPGHRRCLVDAFSAVDVGCFAGDDVTLTANLCGDES